MKSNLHDFLVIWQRFELQDSRSSLLPKEIVRVERVTENLFSQASVTVRIAEKEVTIKVKNLSLYFLKCAWFCPYLWPKLGIWSPYDSSLAL